MPKARQLLDERAALLAELGSLSGLLHGSLVERYSTCSKPNCKCHRGERHGPRRYLVIVEAGRQRQKYIPNSQVEAASAGVAQLRRLKEIINQITLINLSLMKDSSHEDN